MIQANNFYGYFRSDLLSFEQKQRRIDIVQEILTTFNNDPDLIKKIITVDESWLYGYDIETKAQSSQWKAFCFDRGDKRKIEIEIVGDTKKFVSEVF